MMTVSACPSLTACNAALSGRTHDGRAYGIALRGGETERGFPCTGDIGGGFDESLTGATRAGNHQRPLGSFQCAGDLSREGKLIRRGRAWVERVRNCEAEASEIVGRGAEGRGGHVVQARCTRRRNIERTTGVLKRVAHA